MATYDTVATWFESAQEQFQPSRAGGMDLVVQMNVTGEGGGTWHLTIKDKTLTVAEGEAEAPKLTISCSAEDWLKLANRKANAESLYMSGRLRIKGDEYLAQRLAYLFA